MPTQEINGDKFDVVGLLVKAKNSVNGLYTVPDCYSVSEGVVAC